jgi:hypothetical protein
LPTLVDRLADAEGTVRALEPRVLDRIHAASAESVRAGKVRWLGMRALFSVDVDDGASGRVLLPALLLAALGARPALQEGGRDALPLSRVAESSADFDEACTRDGGRLWGVELCGPVLVVDPATRTVLGNQPDAERKLAEQGGVYAGTGRGGTDHP